MDKRPLYQAIAAAFSALHNCEARGNAEWSRRWRDYLTGPLTDALPHGAGFDSGCTIVHDGRTDRIVIVAPFHVMDSNGYYAGWEEYTIHVRPSLAHGFELSCVKGRDRDGVKDYVMETIHAALSEPAPPRVDG